MLPGFRVEMIPPVQSLNVDMLGMKCQTWPSNRLLTCQEARLSTKQVTSGMNALEMISFGHFAPTLSIRSFTARVKEEC